MDKLEGALEKVAILAEALPYIQKFHGKTIVIKYGGNAMINEDLKNAVIRDILLLQLVGINTVLVHGGGPEINQLLKRLDIHSEFINGLRVTDSATMEVVEMVLVGKVNSDIVKHINTAGGNAVGLSGKDGKLLVAKKQYSYTHNADGSETKYDLGQVGEVSHVNVELLESLLGLGYIPVISPVAVGENGESYNVNADIAAGEIAAALKAEKLILLTDVAGIYADFADKDSLLTRLTIPQVEDLMEKGVVAGGMIPKVSCCVQALHDGVTSAHILDGRLMHSILLEILTDQGIGTMVTPG